MTAFRIYSRLDSFYGNTGQLLAGGSLKFYEAGTSTPANVYGNKELTVNNGSTVALDSSGRPNVDVWGSIAYFVEAFDSAGVKQGEADWVQLPGGEGVTLPTPTLGKFLIGNGVAFQLTDIIQLPDMTGQTDKVLSNNGTGPIWIPKPADGTTPTTEPLPAGGVVQTTTSLRAGKWMQQVGTGSAPASGGRTTSVAITFATAMATGLHVSIMPTVAAITGIGYAPVWAVTNLTGTGCTVNFDVNADASGANINVAVPFSYLATGLMA